MRAYTFDVREALIRSGKEEFLRRGFEKASLRTICAKAGVTTGSFYSYFGKKEDLFTAIVEPALKEFSGDCIFREEEDSIGRLISRREQFILLFDCSKGTKYEGFQEKVFSGYMLENCQRQLDSLAGRKVDPALVNILMRMKFEEYRQLIYAERDMEETRRIVKLLSGFSESGLARMIEEMNKDDI